MMKITKQDLIKVCDQFLNDKITKTEVKDFAWLASSSDDYEFDDDDVIAETINDWDNGDINYLITKTNMLLWKKRLITGKDDFPGHEV